MSLLDDLQALNVDDIISARGAIGASLATPDVQNILNAGAASSALGSLGGSLDAVRGDFPDAAALLQPLLQAIEALSGQLETGDLPLERYAAAVREGMQVIVRLAGSLTGDVADFGQIFGTPLGQALQVADDSTSELSRIFGAGADSFAALGRSATEPPRDAAALADLAIDALLPLPKVQLKAARGALELVMSGAGALQLHGDRTLGLSAALDAVALAAESGAEAQLQAALRNLTQVRAHTLGVLRDELAFVSGELDRLRVGQILQPLAELGRGVRLGQQGAIELLEDLRRTLQDLRAQLEAPDLERVRQFIAGLPALIEERARAAVEVPIDHAVERAKDFVRSTFRQLPVRELRDEITRFLAGIAHAIEAANLSGPADSARDALGQLSSLLDPSALSSQVQAALQQVNQVLDDALGGVIDALDTIATRIDALASQAEAILNRLADGLSAFKQAMDSLAASIEGLGIEQIEQQLVDALQALRETASELLANVPLPEPLRPQVEQLIALLEGVDFDEVFEPVRRVAGELRIPDDVAQTVEGGLAEAKRIIDNLIPASLIASIEGEVNRALDTIRGFDPASLLPDVSQYLEAAAGAVESLDPRALGEALRGPFQQLLDAIDRLHPSRLLAPVIEAYDSLLGQLPVPEAQSLAQGLRAGIDGAGRAAGRALVESARRATGGSGDSETGDPEDQAPVAELPPALDEIHAGDAVRLLGYVPARLRELLGALDAGVAGEVIARIDAVSGGLARQIRALSGLLHDTARRLRGALDAQLRPLGPTQLRAQLAIQANFSDHASFQASIDVVALSGPAALRRELGDSLAVLSGAARDMTAGAGGATGAALERLAQALEASSLGRLGADLDGLLAALDPEPIASELDALVARMLELTPQLVAELLPDMRAFVQRLRALIQHYNPGAQAQKFLAVLDVLREELSLLDPRRLAAELAEVHGAVRSALAAYDPRAFAEELAVITHNLAGSIRALDPASLLGDITFLQDTVDRIASANPATRLASVGQALSGVGERLAAIDLDALIDSVNGLGPRLVDSFEALITAVRNEIVALLESLRYAAASGSASADVRVA